MKKIVIIGGGIIGLCSAYYLNQKGYRVIIIDKGDLSKGASNINAGYTTPSHILSLASPGVISKGLKWMWNKSSPFYIKPRWDKEFLKWAWKFKQSSTEAKVKRSIPLLKELNWQSQVLYEELLKTVEFQSYYKKRGLLSVYFTSKAEKEETLKAKIIRSEGLEVNILSREEILKLQPMLSSNVKGAVHYVNDSHSTPNQFIKNLIKWLKDQDVEFILNEQVEQIIRKNGKIEEVVTNKKRYIGDEFVLAAGSWSGELANKLDLNMSLQGGKGYSVDVFKQTNITIPTILTEAKVAVTPMDGFTRFAGTMEFSGQNNVIFPERVKAIVSAAKTYYKNIEISDDEIKNAQSGLRPVSPDGLPYIGRTSKYSNLTVATGHAMIGWSLGPITGKLVCQVIANEKTLIDLTSLSPDRSF